LPAVSVDEAVTLYVPAGKASPAGICSVQLVPLTTRLPSPAVYVSPLTITCSVPSLTVPVIAGVASFVVNGLTVTTGAVTSTVSSCSVPSVPTLPAASVAEAVTLYVPAANASPAGISSV
jgi:hypothetical protein